MAENPKEPLAPNTPSGVADLQQKDPYAVAGAQNIGDDVQAVLKPKEFRSLNEVRYFHVDDSVDWQNDVQTALREELGIEYHVGASQSAQGAIREITELARKNQPIDVVVLDQTFFVSEDDIFLNEHACEEFLRGFTKLLEQPDTREALKDTMVIMYSGTADADFLEKMQKICPRVKALANKRKGGERMAATLAVQLSDAGIVNPDDEKVRKARETLSKPHQY